MKLVAARQSLSESHRAGEHHKQLYRAWSSPQRSGSPPLAGAKGGTGGDEGDTTDHPFLKASLTESSPYQGLL